MTSERCLRSVILGLTNLVLASAIFLYFLFRPLLVVLAEPPPEVAILATVVRGVDETLSGG